MRPLLEYIEDLELQAVLHSSSSLDIYLGRPESTSLYVFTEADLVELTKVFSQLEYPGTPVADAVVRLPEGSLVFRTVESAKRPTQQPFGLTNLLYDPADRKFVDPYGVYPDVRDRRLTFLGESASAPSGLSVSDWRLFTEAAIMVSRYDFSIDEVTPALTDAARDRDLVRILGVDPVVSQRHLLGEIFRARNPKAGFSFLRRVGYIEAHWPELSAMYEVDHTKYDHPEGNLWQHTLETFHYRKDQDLALSLGLLFHDSGKPFAERNDGNMFDRHSQIGTRITIKFLRRLGFDESIVSDVGFLVREHMLPGLIHSLPTYRIEGVMSSLLFPWLLELYRCDLSSTYRGPDGYYRACKVYRSYLKNVRNPFRNSDGKKFVKRYVAG